MDSFPKLKKSRRRSYSIKSIKNATSSSEALQHILSNLFSFMAQQLPLVEDAFIQGMCTYLYTVTCVFGKLLISEHDCTRE